MSRIPIGVMVLVLLISCSFGFAVSENGAAQAKNATEISKENASIIIGNISVDAIGNLTISATGNATINLVFNNLTNINCD